MRTLSFPALLIVAVAPLLAQADDPPARVARINFLNGSVSFRPGSVEEWTAATLNYPLTTGDHLWADNDSRVEIHAGSTAIRMAPRTAMAVLNLDDRTVQLSLTDGSLHIRIRNLEEDESFEVDTPNVAITLLRAGEYRIDADGDTATAVVTVRSGNAEVTGGGAGFVVRPRQSGKAIGMDSVSQDVGPALPDSEFERWCQARDRAEDDASVSAQYVSREMVGYEDLDRNGVWTDTPDYGPVWRPRTVDADWAPYRDGHWAWVDPWGWTWIDDAPWGFAPFHYGRWVVIGGSWVWAPGRSVVGMRPVYAPALVVFIGRPGFNGAAWFPLGPREAYRPMYRHSDYYRRQVNITQVTNINVVNNVYINQRQRGAITATSRDTFIGARRIGREGGRIDEREFGRATVIGTAPQLAPQRVSVMGRVGPAPVAPPARVFDRQVTVRRTPPPTVSFESRRSAIEANQGRPVDRGQVFGGGAVREPRVRVAQPANQNPSVPMVVPRDERAPMRRPMQQTEQQQPMPQPVSPAPRQRDERPVFRPAPQPPAPAPAPVQVPQQREVRQVPQPEQQREVRQVRQPEQQREVRPTPQPEQQRPRFERPQRQEPTPAAPPAPRMERPAAEPRREAQPQPRSEQRQERNTEQGQRGRREPPPEKKDK